MHAKSGGAQASWLKCVLLPRSSAGTRGSSLALMLNEVTKVLLDRGIKRDCLNKSGQEIKP